MKLYCRIDLHSNNHWRTLIDEEDRRLYERRLLNDAAITLAELEPYRDQIVAIAVESTFNWYWLVDALMESGYTVKLVNTCAVRQCDGLKHSDDRHDAFQLAHLSRLGIANGTRSGCLLPSTASPVGFGRRLRPDITHGRNVSSDMCVLHQPGAPRAKQTGPQGVVAMLPQCSFH